MIICSRCNQEKQPHKQNTHLCEDCVKAENSRVSYYRHHNFNWMEVAKEAELEIWERQPAETDLEWSVWLAYRDAYPGRKPSYRLVAEALNTSVGAVKKVGARWDFAIRLQAWAKHVDELTMKQRTQEIIDMNKTHIDMATRINEKISLAINEIDPKTLKPQELQGLMKLATDIERKARLDQPVESGGAVDSNPEIKEDLTKSEDLKEVLGILMNSGIYKTIGVKHSTEIVVKED